jgi:hypothetical protein
MKKVSFGVAVLVSGLMIGCQDSTNPIDITTSSALHKGAPMPIPQYPDGVISVKQIVLKEDSPNLRDFYAVEGTIAYTLVQTEDPSIYAFSLVADLNVRPLSDEKAQSTVYFEIIQDVQIQDKEEINVMQSAVVGDAPSPLRVFLDFRVSNEYVELANIRLLDDTFDAARID